MAGDSKTGLTTFILKKKVDTGDMIDTLEVQITQDMTAGELHDKLMILAGDIAISTIDKLYSGDYKPLLQDESLASPAPKIFREDMEIDFSKNAVDIHNHIRGLSPYPSAWTTMDSKSMKVLKSSLVTSKDDNDDAKAIGVNLSEGEYLIEDNRFIVGTGEDGVIELLEIQLEGKKPTMVSQFIRGYRGEKKGHLS
jgi:methionyl-tRNA formyltransferase